MLGVVIRSFILVYLTIFSTVIAQNNEDVNYVVDNKTLNKRSQKYFDQMPESSELDQYFKYKVLHPVSPFENSNLEIKSLVLDSEYDLSSNQRSDNISTKFVELKNIDENNITNVNSTLRQKNDSNSELPKGYDFQQTSSAQAVLTVDNITFENFYENRDTNNSTHSEHDNKALLRSKTESNVQINEFSNNYSIKHLDDSIFHAQKQINNQILFKANSSTLVEKSLQPGIEDTYESFLDIDNETLSSEAKYDTHLNFNTTEDSFDSNTRKENLKSIEENLDLSGDNIPLFSKVVENASLKNKDKYNITAPSKNIDNIISQQEVITQQEHTPIDINLLSENASVFSNYITETKPNDNMLHMLRNQDNTLLENETSYNNANITTNMNYNITASVKNTTQKEYTDNRFNSLDNNFDLKSEESVAKHLSNVALVSSSLNLNNKTLSNTDIEDIKHGSSNNISINTSKNNFNLNLTKEENILSEVSQTLILAKDDMMLKQEINSDHEFQNKNTSNKFDDTTENIKDVTSNLKVQSITQYDTSTDITTKQEQISTDYDNNQLSQHNKFDITTDIINEEITRRAIYKDLKTQHDNIATDQFNNIHPIDDNPDEQDNTHHNNLNENLGDLQNYIYGSLDDLTQRFISRSSYLEANQPTFYSEELDVVNITVNVNFTLGEGIVLWKSLNLWKTNYIVGIGRAELVLLQSNVDNYYITYKMLNAISTGKEATSADLTRLHFQNNLHIFTIISVENQILWYQISAEGQFIEFWHWLLHSNVKFIQSIKIKNNDLLFTLENGDSSGYAAHLYQFSIEQKKFWLKERIMLECDANVASFNYVEDYVYLSIPQEKLNMVIVYKYVEDRFIPYQNLESSSVNFVTSFSVGHKNFLAIGGLNHAIYRLDLYGIRPETILDSTFDNVQYYLPVHIRTYRDDLIVLVQHEIDYESHNSLHIEALIWTENGFVTSQHEVCDYHGDLSYGFQCLLDEESDAGLIGSVVINLGRNVNILTPRLSIHSEAFDINTRLIQPNDPRQEELYHLYKIRDTLEANFKHQSQVLIDSKIALENSLNVKGDVLVKSEWYVNEVQTPIYREESTEMIWSDGFLTMSNIRFTKEDTTIHIPTLVEQSDRILASVLDLAFVMKDAVKIRDTNIKLAENLTILGDFKVEGGWKAESLCVNDLNGKSFNELFNKLMYEKQTIKYNDEIRFDKVYVDNLYVDYLNEYSASNILYKSPEIIVQGNLNFFEEIHFDRVFIKDSINGIKFDNLLRVNTKHNYLALDEVNVLGDIKVRKLNGFLIDEKELSDVTNARQQRDINNLKEIKVLGDISFETINGMNWKKFISNVVWKNSPRVMKNAMIVEGDIKCSEPCLLYMPIINGLSFPSDFILSGTLNNNFTNTQIMQGQYIIVPNSQENFGPEQINAPDSILITGHKTFINLNVKNIDCPGLVNGINTEDVITLEGDQNISGLVSFENLKVTEGLHVGGLLKGKYLDNFTANPSLKDSLIIDSNVIFKHLEVDGPIYVENINGSNLANSLSDVVYATEEDVTIHGYKIFESSLTIKENLELTSNRINGIDTDLIMTTNTEQILNIKNLNGNIVFKDLTLPGLVDGVNLTDLFVNTVKIYGDQYISSEITFNGKTTFASVNIDKLSGKNVNELFTIDEPIYFNTPISFDKIIVENLNVDKLQIENDMLCNVNLKDIQENCLSLTKPQYISADYYVDVVNANSVESSNTDVVHNTRKKRNITQVLNFDYKEIDELIIEGDITTGQINGYSFKEIVENAIWLNKENIVTGTLQFLEGFTASDIEVNGLVNGYDFNSFIDDLVLAEENIKLYGPKTFMTDLVVDTIETNQINSIEMKNILTKDTKQAINADFAINGDVIMDNAECTGTFNGMLFDEIKSRYSYEDDYHVLNGDVVFTNPTIIENLTLDYFNNVNLHEFISRLVLTTDETTSSISLNFENEVFFNNNLTVLDKYNGINLNEFANNLVFIDKDFEIAYPVIFENDVVFAGDVKFEGNLTASTISGCDTRYWQENRISIRDGATISGNKIFSNIASPEFGWTARTLNEHDLSTIFTLNTDQIIPQNVHFSNLVVQESLELKGLLNGKNLSEEVYNTLMIRSDHVQVIETAATFKQVYIEDSLELKVPVNAKYNMNNVFTLNTDQIIYTPGHAFEDILVPYLDINGTVSGIDFNEWVAKALKKSATDQVITGHWYIDTADFQNNILGNNMINNRDMHNLADEVEKQRLLLELREKELKDEYISYCLDVQYLLDLSNKYLYLLKYFEETQVILSSNAKSIHTYNYGDKYYLIVNNGVCKSTIYKWNAELRLFKHSYVLETGVVDKWITVENNGSKFLISISEQNLGCNIDLGTNVWYVIDEMLRHVFKLGPGIREVLAGNDGAFYTIEGVGVSEYTFINYGNELQKVGSWSMYTDESTFVPREAGFDLSLSDGKRVTKLSKTDHSLDKSAYEIFGSEPVIAKSLVTNEISTTECPYLPKRGNGEVLVVTVGLGSSLRQMVAVSVLENATVGGNYDFIKIYDDVMEGKLFQTLPCLRPSSLVSINFGQGQTILAFIEDLSHIKIYDYRGIEGFKHLYTFNFSVTKLSTVVLPINKDFTSHRHFILASGNDGLRVLIASMHGDRIHIKDQLSCKP